MIDELLNLHPNMAPKPKTAFEITLTPSNVDWSDRRARVDVKREGRDRRYILKVDSFMSCYKEQELILSDDELDAVLVLLTTARDAERKGAPS